MISQPDFLVIGGGIVGVSAARELARAGHRVLLVERDVIGAPNPISSSGDHSKVFRHAYGPDEAMTRMCAAVLPLWREIEERSGAALYARTGALVFGSVEEEGENTWARQSVAVMARCGLGGEWLDREAIRDRFPPLGPAGRYDHAVLDREAGVLQAQEAVPAIGRLAREAGAEIQEHTSIHSLHLDGDEVRAVETSRGTVVPRRAVILAAGAWGPALYPPLAERTYVTRQQVVYLRPRRDPAPYAPERFPVIAKFREGFYMLPLHPGPAGDPRAVPGGCLKIAGHLPVERVDPSGFGPPPGFTPSPSRGGSGGQVDPAFIDACRAFLADYVPDLADFELAATRVCLYTNTLNETYVLDRVGNLVVASACSGHGFKVGPLTGRMAAELAMGTQPMLWSERFSLQSHAACE